MNRWAILLRPLRDFCAAGFFPFKPTESAAFLNLVTGFSSSRHVNAMRIGFPAYSGRNKTPTQHHTNQIQFIKPSTNETDYISWPQITSFDLSDRS